MPPGLPPDRFGLGPFRSPLLRELLLLSFPVGTEMFQFPTFPPPVLCVHTGVTPHNGRRVSPFGHPRINAFSAASRGLSQPDTSFIGSRRQGIHRWLFVAWKNKDARARYAVLKGQSARCTWPGAQQGPRRMPARALKERPFRTEQRTERPSSAGHRE